MNNHLCVTEVNVGINFGKGVQAVGRLAARDHKIYFEKEYCHPTSHRWIVWHMWVRMLLVRLCLNLTIVHMTHKAT